MPAGQRHADRHVASQAERDRRVEQLARARAERLRACSAGRSVYHVDRRRHRLVRAHLEIAAGRQLQDAVEHRLGRVVGEAVGQELEDARIVRGPRHGGVDEQAP